MTYSIKTSLKPLKEKTKLTFILPTDCDLISKAILTFEDGDIKGTAESATQLCWVDTIERCDHIEYVSFHIGKHKTCFSGSLLKDIFRVHGTVQGTTIHVPSPFCVMKEFEYFVYLGDKILESNNLTSLDINHNYGENIEAKIIVKFTEDVPFNTNCVSITNCVMKTDKYFLTENAKKHYMEKYNSGLELLRFKSFTSNLTNKKGKEIRIRLQNCDKCRNERQCYRQKIKSCWNRWMRYPEFEDDPKYLKDFINFNIWSPPSEFENSKNCFCDDPIYRLYFSVLGNNTGNDYINDINLRDSVIIIKLSQEFTEGNTPSTQLKGVSEDLTVNFHGLLNINRSYMSPESHSFLSSKYFERIIVG